MAKLENKTQTLYNFTVLPIYSVAATPTRSRDRGNKLTKGHGHGFYVNK